MRSPLNPGHASGRQQTKRYQVGPSHDGGIWQGPTEAVWMKRLLRGAPPPRASTGITPEARVARTDSKVDIVK